MFVVTNRIPVAPGMEAKFEERFRGRVKLVDREPGFIRNFVMRPINRRMNHQTGQIEEKTEQGYYLVQTHWEREEDFWKWTKSDSFRKAHAERPPSDMFAGHSALEVHEVALSSENNE